MLKNVNEDVFSFIFYENFHASVTLFFFLWIFLKFHQNVELRKWELFTPFLEVFADFLMGKGPILSAPNQA